MRSFKTILAVFSTIYISNLLGREDVTIGLIAACMTVGTTVVDSFEDAKNRLGGTFIGATVGVALFMVKPGDGLLISLGVGAIIYLCNVFRIGRMISISCMVFFSIILSTGEVRPIYDAIDRVIDSGIGIILAIIINIIIFPPNKYKDIRRFKNLFIVNAQNIIYKLDNKQGFTKELDILEKCFYKLTSYIAIEENEFKISHKKDVKRLKVYSQISLYRDLMENLKDSYKILNEISEITEDDTNFQLNKDNLNIVLNYHIQKGKDDYNLLQNNDIQEN
ncbi:MAG: FUSC family protein [Oscillospiraceae bacterium]